jgi:hypothetical protein
VTEEDDLKILYAEHFVFKAVIFFLHPEISKLYCLYNIDLISLLPISPFQLFISQYSFPRTSKGFFVKMSETERQDSAAISSSAERMVGMDHAEVRYFTR